MPTQDRSGEALTQKQALYQLGEAVDQLTWQAIPYVNGSLRLPAETAEKAKAAFDRWWTLYQASVAATSLGISPETAKRAS